MRASPLLLSLAIVCASTAARAYAVGPPVALEELARRADLACKGVVVADAAVTDPWFDPPLGYEAHETKLHVVACVKGKSPGFVRFRHYAEAPAGGPIAGYTPPHVRLEVGRAYWFFAAAAPGGVHRILTKSPTSLTDVDAMLAADARPPRAATITAAIWSELLGLAASPRTVDAIMGLRKLDQLSGGQGTNLHDFPRAAALAEITRALASRDPLVAGAALDVFGEDAPCYDDRVAPFWLAGMGHGTITGLSPRRPSGPPSAAVAAPALLPIADAGATPELRAKAIRALGGVASVPDAKIAAWALERDPLVRAAATLASALRADRSIVRRGAADASAEVRAAAALAIGFTQDPKLVPLLSRLLVDPDRAVHEHAAMSLLSFSVDDAAPALRQGLAGDYRSIFVNALARRDPKPYLPILADVIVKRASPRDWWGGTIPAGDSWEILFAYVKSRPAAELTSGRLDASLSALERMQWYSSSQARDLYALYVARKMTRRAATFRAASQGSPLQLTTYFDEVDKNPAAYPP